MLHPCVAPINLLHIRTLVYDFEYIDNVKPVNLS